MSSLAYRSPGSCSRSLNLLDTILCSLLCSAPALLCFASHCCCTCMLISLLYIWMDCCTDILRPDEFKLNTCPTLQCMLYQRKGGSRISYLHYLNFAILYITLSAQQEFLPQISCPLRAPTRGFLARVERSTLATTPCTHPGLYCSRRQI